MPAAKGRPAEEYVLSTAGLPRALEQADEFAHAGHWILIVHHMPCIGYARVKVAGKGMVGNIRTAIRIHLPQA